MSIIGELNYFLRLQIKQSSDYTKELIKKFGQENVKVSKTAMATTTKLDKDEQDKNINFKLYRSIIGSLLYLTASKRTSCLVYVFVLNSNLV